MTRWLTAFLLPLIFVPTAALADASQCSDVLANGTFQTQNIRDNSYFQQIIYSRFARSTYQASSSDRSGGFGVPVGEIVLGGNYSEAQFRRKQEELQRTYFNQITATREIDVALASGDPLILEAWSDCMRGKAGGLAMRFEAAGPSDIFAYVEWFPQGIQNSTKLTDSVVFPAEITVVDGGKCFKRGTKIIAGNPCRARLASREAKKALPVVMNSTHGSTQAFLPARIVRVRDVKRHPGSNTRLLESEGFRNYLQPTGALVLSDEEIRQGWTFDSAATSARLYVIATHGGMNSCHSSWQKIEVGRFAFGFTIFGSTRGNDRNRHIWCAMDVSAMLWRDRWIGADETTDSPTGTTKSFTGGAAGWFDDESYEGLEASLPAQGEG